MNCPNCGVKLESDAVFCPLCGAKVKSLKKSCVKCGAEMEEGTLFCGHCGARFGNSANGSNTAYNEKQSAETVIKPRQSNTSVISDSLLKIIVGLAVIAIVTLAGFARYKHMKSNSEEVLYNKAILCYAAQNYTEAKGFFEKAASKGNADAMYRLGDMYARGTGVPKNHQEAKIWCRKAEKAYLDKIEKGDYKVIGDLFLKLYIISEGDLGNDDVITLKPDDALLNKLGKQYIRYLNDEINKGNPDALQMLGDIYSSYGTGWEVGMFLKFVEDDKITANGFEYTYPRATELYQKAFAIYQERAESGDTDAMYNLGIMYLCEEGVEKNETAAMQWLNNAAEKGSIQAKCFLMQQDE